MHGYDNYKSKKNEYNNKKRLKTMNVFRKSNILRRLLVIFALFVASTAFGLTDSFVKKNEQSVVVDGKLDEPVWNKATSLNSLFILNSKNLHAKEATQVKYWHNGKSLFIGFICSTKNLDDLKANMKRKDSSVWDDDCIEVFLSPSPDAEPYYHFIVNSIGTKADFMVRSNGMNKDINWNGNWKAAAIKTPKGYNVEMELPFKMFGKPAAMTWRGAFARENKVIGEYSCWPVMRGGFHNPSQFAILNGVKVDKSCFMLTINDANFKLEKIQYGIIKGKLDFSIDAEKAYNKPEINFTLKGKDDFVIQKRLSLSLKKGINSIEIPVSLLDEGKFVAELFIVPPNKDDACRFKKTFRVSKNSFEAELIFPRYRNLIMDSMKLKEIILQVKTLNAGLKNKKFHIALSKKDGSKIGTPISVVLSEGIQKIKYPVPSSLDYGEYLLKIWSGKDEQTIKLKKIKITDDRPQVYFDEYNNMLVDGKKMFPLGFYYGTPDVKNYKSSGFNIVLSTNKRYLNLYDKHKIYTIGFAAQIQDKTFKPKIEKVINQSAIEETEKQFAKKYPYTVGWYVADEPELFVSNKALYKQAMQLLKKMSPQLPIISTHNNVYGLAMDSSVVDIVSMDPYLGFERNSTEPFVSYDRISTYMDEAVKIVRNRKPVWAVLQTFPSGYYSGDTSKARFPTIKEVRAMTYLAVIHGAKGIVYWYSGVLKARKLWASMKYFAKEVKYLSPFLLSGDYGNKKLTGAIHYFSKKLKNKECIIAVNISNKKLKTSIIVKKALTYNVLSEDRTIKAKNGMITDTFEPYETHIYCSSEVPKLGLTNVLKTFKLSDSYIGISGKDNLANFWYGAVPSASTTNPYRKVCQAIDGAFCSDWVAYHDSNPYYEVKLYRKGKIKKLIVAADKLPGKLEIFNGVKWEICSNEPTREYYTYWDDDANKWKEADKETGSHNCFKCYEFSVNKANQKIEKIKVSGLNAIRQIEVFE